MPFFFQWLLSEPLGISPNSFSRHFNENSVIAFTSHDLFAIEFYQNLHNNDFFPAFLPELVYSFITQFFLELSRNPSYFFSGFSHRFLPKFYQKYSKHSSCNSLKIGPAFFPETFRVYFQNSSLDFSWICFMVLSWNPIKILNVVPEIISGINPE